MAELIDHIDEIARSKNTDVIWIQFTYPEPTALEAMPQRLRKSRNKIIGWLDEQKISYELCFGFSDGALEEPYVGDLYIELPVDPSNIPFRYLQRMLENADYSPRIEGIRMIFLPLKMARENGNFYTNAMKEF
jgi:hypothetical protein